MLTLALAAFLGTSTVFVAEDLPLINVAEWGFITVVRTSVKNVSNNPRWAVSNWADTWLET